MAKQIKRIIIFFLIILPCVNQNFATTKNIYNAQGDLIAECQLSGEKTCRYSTYKGLSQVGTVEDQTYQRYFHGPSGKIAVSEDIAKLNVSFLVPDFHGSVLAVKTSEIDQVLLDAFGNQLNAESSAAIYTDKHKTEGAELYNFNARFYDAEIGRFMITDPIEQSNLNWYIYARNNPLSFIDPTGMTIGTPDMNDPEVINYLAALETRHIALDSLHNERAAYDALVADLTNKGIAIEGHPRVDEMLHRVKQASADFNKVADDFSEMADLLASKYSPIEVFDLTTKNAFLIAQHHLNSSGRLFKPVIQIDFVAKKKITSPKGGKGGAMGLLIGGVATAYAATYPDSALAQSLETVNAITESMPPVSPFDMLFLQPAEVGSSGPYYDFYIKQIYFGIPWGIGFKCMKNCNLR